MSKKLPVVLGLCILVLLTACIALAEETSSSDSSLYVNPNGGRCFHRTPECASIDPAYYGNMAPIPADDLTIHALNACKVCFAMDVPWFGSAEMDSAYPKLNAYMSDHYGQDAQWDIVSWKISENGEFFSPRILLHGPDQLDLVEILLTRWGDQWLVVQE